MLAPERAGAGRVKVEAAAWRLGVLTDEWGCRCAHEGGTLFNSGSHAAGRSSRRESAGFVHLAPKVARFGRTRTGWRQLLWGYLGYLGQAAEPAAAPKQPTASSSATQAPSRLSQQETSGLELQLTAESCRAGLDTASPALLRRAG